MQVIKTEHLVKSFRKEEIETIAVDNLSLEVDKGEFVAIMGPSGCGKTTLLNILGLLDAPTSGKYFLNGEDVSTLNERARTFLRRVSLELILESLVFHLQISYNNSRRCPVPPCVRQYTKALLNPDIFKE